MLRACLLDEPLPRLMAMADLWGAPLEATSAHDVADSLSAHMLQENHLSAEREALPDDARTALGALSDAGGKMPVAAFERRFGSIRPMGPGKLERERPWLAPANAAEVLWYLGFIFRAFDRATGTPTEVIFVPSDLYLVLSSELKVPSESTALINHLTQNSELKIQNSKLLDDITTLLCHIQNHEVKLKANGEWDVASRRALLPTMRDVDGVADNQPNGRFAFLIHLIDRLGWTRPVRNRLRLIPQPVTQWLQSKLDAQRDALFNAWLNDPDWNDLAHIEGLSLQMTHAWSNDPLHERKAIVRMWEQWRIEKERVSQFFPSAALQGRSASFNSQFIEHVKATNPDFARPDGRYDTWHVRDEQTDEFLHGFENWERVEGALIRHVIEKPLVWLSLDPARDISSPLSPNHPVSVSKVGSITVAAWLRFERFQLARIANWVEMRDDAYVYQLSPRSLGRAREGGIRVQRAIEFLEESSGMPLPASLQRALLRWSERGTEARLEPMALLRTQDVATMDALLRLPEVRRAVVDRFAPNCISIRQRDVEDAHAAIVESGLFIDAFVLSTSNSLE